MDEKEPAGCASGATRRSRRHKAAYRIRAFCAFEVAFAAGFFPLPSGRRCRRGCFQAWRPRAAPGGVGRHGGSQLPAGSVATMLACAVLLNLPGKSRFGLRPGVDPSLLDRAARQTTRQALRPTLDTLCIDVGGFPGAWAPASRTSTWLPRRCGLPRSPLPQLCRRWCSNAAGCDLAVRHLQSHRGNLALNRHHTC